MSLFFDEYEPTDRNGYFEMETWPYICWPLSKKYRIVLDKNKISHQLRLQARQGRKWIEVETYDHGYDDYGKLRPSGWVNVSDQCAWEKSGLEMIARHALGIKLKVLTLKVLGK